MPYIKISKGASLMAVVPGLRTKLYLGQDHLLLVEQLILVERYKRFYFRAGKLAEMSAELFRRPDMAARRLREGGEFVRFLGRRTRTPAVP